MMAEKSHGKRRVVSSYKTGDLRKADPDKPLTHMTSRADNPNAGFYNAKITERSNQQAAVANDFTAAVLEGAGLIGSPLLNTSQYLVQSHYGDQVDVFDQTAVRLIAMLLNDGIQFEVLSNFDKKILFRYFYRNNPIISRIIQLHTDLPLSRIRLQAPQGQPEIVSDYIMHFFGNLLEDLKFNIVLRDAVIDHYVFGEAQVYVDDFFDGEAELQPLRKTSKQFQRPTKANEDFMDDIEKRYAEDPWSVPLEDRLKYLAVKFTSYFDSEYQGPDAIRLIEFYEVLSQESNQDIGYEVMVVALSESLKYLISESPVLTFNDFLELGYNKGFLAQLFQGESNEHPDNLVVDNDTYSGLPFFFTIKDGHLRGSMIQSLVTHALEWEASRKALFQKLKTIGRVGRIVTASGAKLSEEQAMMLETQVITMLSNPDHAIVANYDINWQEVPISPTDELSDVINRSKDLIDELGFGAGMPTSLISGDAQYSGSNIQLEVLNNIYLALQQRLTSAVEESFLKPIAQRKGFVTVDEWGKPQLLFPRVTFTRNNLRDSTTFDLLMSLYLKGSLPVSILYEILNIDPDEARRGIENDMFTVMDPNFNNMVNSLYNEATTDIYATSDLVDKLMENLGLHKKPEGSITDSLTLNSDLEQPAEEEGEPVDDSMMGLSSETSPEFHTAPEKGPPRYDLRKPRLLNDPDLNLEDPDLKSE